MKKQILLNISSNYLWRGVAMILGLFLVPFLIGKLGVQAFGVIVLAESLARFIDLVSSSLRMALSRHMTFSLSKGDQDAFNEYLSTGRVMLFVAGAAVFIVAGVASYFIPSLIRVPVEYAGQSRILFFMMTIAFAITFPNMAFWSVLYAKQRYDLLNFASAAAIVFRAIIVFILFTFLPHKYVSLTVYGVVYLLTVWADNFMIYLWSRMVMPGLKIRFACFSRGKVRDIFMFGMFTSIGYSSSVFYENAIQIFINQIWGPAANALYGVASKFPVTIKRLLLEPAWTLTPSFTALIAKKEYEKARRFYFSYSKFVAVVAVPPCLFLALFSGTIIRLWIGPEFDTAASMMSVLVTPLMFVIPAAVSSCLFNAYAKIKVPSIVSMTAAAVQLAAGIGLARYAHMGLIGVSLAESGMSFVIGALFYTYYACRVSNIPLRCYWLEAFLPAFAWGMVMSGGLILAFSSVSRGKLTAGPLLFAEVALWALLYSVGVYRWVLNDRERTHLSDIIRPLWARPSPPLSDPNPT